ncbi:MAG TPA: MoaD/ThiS family protein [Kofleriaceae bacterium]
MVNVIFPSQFAKVLNGQLRQVGSGSNLREVLSSICEAKSDLRKILFLPTEEVSPFIGFALQGEDKIYTHQMIASIGLKPGDSIEVILSMAGG